MNEAAGTDVRCECGKIILQRSPTPAKFLIKNNLHKLTIRWSCDGLSIRGRCPGCSKLHTLTYGPDAIAEAEISF